jgi:hypothetical protein
MRKVTHGTVGRTASGLDTSIVKKICINPTSAFNSYTRLSQGLDLAIANYNSLGLSFTMARGPATGCNANITGLQSYSVDVNEHVITHQLGHTLGGRLEQACTLEGCAVGTPTWHSALRHSSAALLCLSALARSLQHCPYPSYARATWSASWRRWRESGTRRC